MNRTREALQFISSDDRETWVAMGMACKAEYGNDAFEIWDEWSKQSKSYNKASALSVWRSIKESGGITAATLYFEAMKNGWKDSGERQTPTREQIAEMRMKADERRIEEEKRRELVNSQAAKKAGWILHQCSMEKHAYLDSKGFPELDGMVWNKSDDDNLLVIPMRIERNVVGCQMINRDGEKKFVQGQIASGAEYLIDAGGRDFYIEGYASGLSLREVLNALKIRYRIHVCFSASNMQKLATDGIVIADNDKSGTGERAAIATGLPYWISEKEGEDINDAHQRLGIFRLSQEIRKFLSLQR